MQPVQPLTTLLSRFWQHISPRRRRQFGLLLVLVVFASFAEIVSIGAVLPFLGVLTSPASIFEYPVARPFIQALRLTERGQLLLPLTIGFALAVLLAGAMRLSLLWVSTRLSFATAADLSSSIYRRTLCQPYAVHVARNSSEVIDGISVKVWNILYAIIERSGGVQVRHRPDRHQPRDAGTRRREREAVHSRVRERLMRSSIANAMNRLPRR